jgi:hypothetical protein
MSPYSISSISLAPIPGVHNGTGNQHDPGFATVVPASVPGSGNLQFVGADVALTTMLFELNSDVVVPNWFGVAVPSGIQDFTRPNIFFHPTPGQAGYNDADDPNKSGLWPDLFYYMERLGKQVAGADRGQIVIMPFLTNAATDTGILPGIWHDTVTDILTQARASLGADDGSSLAISQLVVSSFSDGIIYSHSFRTRAADMAPLLAEIWDLDGGLSSYRSYSTMLETDPHPVIQYDSATPSYPRSNHVPWPRWADFYDTANIPKNAFQVHPLIRDFMFLHGASVSSVGSLIAPGPPEAVPQAPPAPEPPSAPAPAPPPQAPGALPGPPIIVTPSPSPIPIPGPTPSPMVVPTLGPTVAPTPPATPILAPRPGPIVRPPPAAPFPVLPMPTAPTLQPVAAPRFPFPSPTAPEPSGVPSGGAREGARYALPPKIAGGCCAAVVGIVATASTTAQAAITAIAAIASLETEC